MKYLITGGCGFLGSNLANEILLRGDELVIFDNTSRTGTQKNLEWLKSVGSFTFVHGDIRNANDVDRLIQIQKPDVVFHLAGQVTMTGSITDPRKDFETNALGTFNVLESIRKHSPSCAVLYSSTNKVYGDLEELTYVEGVKRYVLPQFPEGLPETISLNFSSPYGCSKGSADQYMLDYNRIHGLKTVVFRHSSMYGSRQYSTIDQGWLGWFCEQAVKTKEDPTHTFTISGNGKQVRDVLHADDMVALYFSAVKKINDIKGQAFNIGGGAGFSLSLLELFDILEKELAITLNYTMLPARESDQKVFIADIQKAKKLIDWVPKVTPQEGIKNMIKWTAAK